MLARVALVESFREGRQLRYRALGWRLTELARDLDAVGRGWDRRLSTLKDLAEATQPTPIAETTAPADSDGSGR